jgi:flavin reductase (DIM6/NTAB) family NADH-FMN oxidoreductase RutF
MTNGHNGDRRPERHVGADGPTLEQAVPSFRGVAGTFATGVAVVTSIADDVPVGMTVNAFATVSLDPTLVLICLRNGCRLLSSIQDSNVFAATVLAAQQQRQAQWFANRARPTGAAAFAGVATRPAPVTGCPLLGDGLAYFDCFVHELYPGGDHAVVLGRVAAYGPLRPREPLLFAGGRYVGGDSLGVLPRQNLGPRTGGLTASRVEPATRKYPAMPTVAEPTSR